MSTVVNDYKDIPSEKETLKGYVLSHDMEMTENDDSTTTVVDGKLKVVFNHKQKMYRTSDGVVDGYCNIIAKSVMLFGKLPKFEL